MCPRAAVNNAAELLGRHLAALPDEHWRGLSGAMSIRPDGTIDTGDKSLDEATRRMMEQD